MIETHTKASSNGLAGLPRAQIRTFERNEFVFNAGCAADAGYLIRAGQVRCYLLDPDGRETTTAVLGPGQFVGMASLLGREAHREFCEALTKVEAWSLPVDELRQGWVNVPALQGWLLGAVGQRFELALALRRGVSLLSVPERASDLHMRLRALAGVDPRTVRQTILAGLLQIRPETLARAHRLVRPGSQPGAKPADEPSTAKGRHEYAARTVVVDSDLPPGCIGQVVSGRVELSLAASGSRALVVETLGPGDLFGFASLLGLPAVPFRIEGVSDGAIEVVPANEFLQQLARATAQSSDVVMRLAERLEALDQELARAGLPDVGERLVYVLRQVASSGGPAMADGAQLIPAGWSHVALARHLGVCRETVTRGLATLVKAGIITRQGRRIILLSDKTWHARPAADRKPEPTPGAAAALQQTRRERSIRAAEARTRRRPRHRANRCRMCGLRTPGALCVGCADRLERDLVRNREQACPNCGRHRELCNLMPCKTLTPAPSRVSHDPSVVWLPTASIDEPGAEHNSRGSYKDSSIRELAESLRNEGFLQPLCVRRKGGRFELVFGVRRFRAATQAGLSEVPCTIRDADDDQALLLNAVENLHREQLTNLERVRTIERLASSGFGVREISRRTGFNPSTISRWLRINRLPELKQALEDDRVDIARAVILVDAPPSALRKLIARAPALPAAELRRQVAALKTNHGATMSESSQRHYLEEALRCLRAVREPLHEPGLIEAVRSELDRISEGRHSSNGHLPG